MRFSALIRIYPAIVWLTLVLMAGLHLASKSTVADHAPQRPADIEELISTHPANATRMSGRSEDEWMESLRTLSTRKEVRP